MVHTHLPQQPVPEHLLQLFRQKLGSDAVLDDPSILRQYSSDMSEDLVFPPSVVLRPANTAEVAFILCEANQSEPPVPVYARGRGTGLAGSSLATRGGICLSLERMNRILKVDSDNLEIVTEPYVLNYEIQEAARKVGLFYPPDPASYRICSIGGNIAMNSSGPKAVKYGGTRNYVSGMELVLANGKILQIGSHTLKNSSGYSLTQLLIGSEGTLGIVTKIILRLIPLPHHDNLVLLTFKSLREACTAVHGILAAGIVPCGLELMERKALQYAKDYANVNFPPLSDGIAAHLLVELDGDNAEQLAIEQQQLISLVRRNFAVAEVFPAENEQQKQDLWSLRRKVYVGIKSHNVIKEMDFCVPIAALPDMIKKMEELGREYGFDCATYGHAGDGNLHVGVIPPAAGHKHGPDEERIREGIRQIFAYACSLGGVISGEHGIGLVQRPYLPLLYDAVQLDLMRSIKKVFDPNGILNPDKIF